MDQRPLSRLYQSINGIKLHENYTILLGQNFMDGRPFLDKNDVDVPPPFLLETSSGNLLTRSIRDVEENPHEDCDFNDVALKYISQILMEEDMEEKTCMLQESLALEATEKSFYDVIGENYPPSVDHHHGHGIPSSIDENHHQAQYEISTTSFGGDNLVEPWRNWDVAEYRYPYNMISLPTFSSPSNTDKEDRKYFLPNGNGLFVGEMNQDGNGVGVEMEKKQFAEGSRGKKNSHREDLDGEEERNTKQSASYDELTIRSEILDQVLLSDAVKVEAALRESLQNDTSKNVQLEEEQSEGQGQGQSKRSSNPRKLRGRRKGRKMGVVDLSTLLTQCAQDVVAGDQRSAAHQLKQIRLHVSPTGDGMQRMCHYFANGLEARLAGSGTQIYRAVFTKGTSAADILKAYHLFLAICPFKKLLNSFSNITIRKLAEEAESLHIIDFGISYGFQWPSLIQCLASRPGGPPKLRITGIDLPQAGFRPAERVQETGRRLTNYAKSFNVPFQFTAIAQKWETIKVGDLKNDTQDVLVVNCHCRFRNLLDETVTAESPRDTVLKLIRKMNPDVFIQGIVNGGYGVPFFRTRFREALFHFSSLFDMLDHIVPRDRLERTLIEREFLGWEAMNVIACEGSERIERPESYKQWQFRNIRAGFVQLPLDDEIVGMAKEKLRVLYHKDFIIDEDGRWLLQGWKGRTLYAISSWKPAPFN